MRPLDVDEPVEDVKPGVLRPDPLPQARGLVPVRVGRITRAVCPTEIERQKPGSLALQLRAEAHFLIVDRLGFSVASYLTDVEVWRRYFRPGMAFGFGPGWWAVLAPAVMYLVLRFGTGVPPLETHMLRTREMIRALAVRKIHADNVHTCREQAHQRVRFAAGGAERRNNFGSAGHGIPRKCRRRW